MSNENPFTTNGYPGSKYVNFLFNKATPIKGYNPDEWRRDAYGNHIAFSRYGLQCYGGWDIDHIHPKSLGGDNTLANLQPLEYSTNRSIGNKTLGKKFIKTYYLRKWCMDDH